MTDIAPVAPGQVSWFDGETFDKERDGVRLTGLLARVRFAMGDGRWHTLAQLARDTGGSEASVSARLRDLRKPRFGAFEIERRHVDGGLWEYRMSRKEPGA